MRVLVTGGTGFLGGHLVEELEKAGHEPIVFARSTSKTGHFEDKGILVRRGAFDDSASLRRACEGVDAVIHAAGGGVVREVSDFYRANTESTKALLASLTTQTDFVLISSLAAHGAAQRSRHGFATPVAFEDDDDAPSSHYGKSKKLAEQACQKAPQRCTILRPPALYGAGKYRMAPLFRLAKRGFVPTVHPRGTLSLLSGGDCARAAVAALSASHDGGVFYVAEPEPITRLAMAKAIARVGGHSRVVSVPPLLLRGAAVLSEGISSLRGATAMFNRDKAADMCAPHQSCDPRKAESAFAWRAEERFVTSTLKIARAYQAKGWIS